MNFNKDHFFNLHSSIIPVKGFKKSILCDLQKNTYREIPNDLYSLLIDFKEKTINSVYEKYDITTHKVLDQIFEFLIEEDYVFLSKSKSNIQKLPLNFPVYSEIINNSIIDINGGSDLNSVKKFIEELNDFGCKNLSLRFFDDFKFKKVVLNILKFIENKTIRYIELTINSNLFEKQELITLLNKNVRVYIIWIYGSKEDELIESNHQKIIFSKAKNINSKSCGKISPTYFFSDITMFSLNKNVNSCLYGKISLDVNGNIKNCPSLNNSFGDIRNNSINDVLLNEDFKELWNINKDQINVCKDCEFRYICSDCRAYIDNKYEKPFKCKYNPYEGIWED